MSSLVKKISICIVFIFSAVWYAQANFYRDPGSAFFDESRAYQQKYSIFRKEQTQNFIDGLHAPSSGIRLQEKTDQNASLCVALSSVSRGADNDYLETTIGSLLQGLTARERADLHLNVLIAETDPSNHPSWRREWVHQAVDDIFTYDVGPDEAAYVRSLEEQENFARKGVYDYVYALQQCFDTGAPYIGVFEDDILLADGWLVRALRGLRKIEDDAAAAEQKGTKSKPWLFLRLFNQERSTGWAHRNIGANNEVFIVLGIGLGLTVPALLARWKWRSARSSLDMETIWVMALLLNPAMVVLFFQSGKASTLPPSPGVFAQPFGCCSQAMIFPRSQVQPLIQYLQSWGQGQVDILLTLRARNENLARYNLYPVQAQHIGTTSARKTDKDEAQAIWSMAYEDLDPAELEREHAQMVNEYYDEL